MRCATLLLMVLGVGLLAGDRALAQEEEQQWTKADCASAHLLPPPGIRATCFEGPFTQVGGQSYACRLSNESFGFFPEGTEPHAYARVRYPKKGGKICATIPFANPEGAMRHVHKFVENEATNWSAPQAIGDDISVMFFDAKNHKRDGKCFTFTKLGPSAGYSDKGHRFSMIGFFCKAPGQPLDAAVAAALVNAIQVKTEE
jgi:hypothetical protein